MKVGDYVRTKQGYIRQIKEIYDHILYYVNLDKSITMERYGKFEPITQLDRDTIDEIIKSSPNIIDLIEAGDLVNGMEVMEADWFNENGEYEEGLAFPMYASDDLQVIENWLPLRIVNIKSIVTKEQFEVMEYKVGVDKE